MTDERHLDPHLAECECEEEHSVTKLGHSRDCPHHGKHPPQMPVCPLKPGCPPEHLDGTPHDFEWATYVSGTISTGVCRCGLEQWSYDMWRMP